MKPRRLTKGCECKRVGIGRGTIRLDAGDDVGGKVGMKQSRRQSRGLESSPPQDYLVAIVPGHSYGRYRARILVGIKDRSVVNARAAVSQVHRPFGISGKVSQQIGAGYDYTVWLLAGA